MRPTANEHHEYYERMSCPQRPGVCSTLVLVLAVYGPRRSRMRVGHDDWASLPNPSAGRRLMGFRSPRRAVLEPEYMSA